jgi:TonB family protein
MHSHPPRVVVYLSDVSANVALPDGRSHEVEAHAGEAQWFDAASHAVENLSDQPFDAIEIELKGRPGPTTKPLELDPARVDPTHHKVEFENDRARIMRGTMGPHEKTPWHDHGARVQVWLTDADIRVTSPDGKTQEVQRKAREADWSGPLRHVAENLSDQPFEVVVVELKQAPATAPIGSFELLTPTGGVDFTGYLAKTMATIKLNWYALMPQSAAQGKPGQVIVEFRILRDGALSMLNLTHSSGEGDLDRAALAAIHASEPFPKLPDAFHGPFIGLRVKFAYNSPVK